ncbi:MAG: DegT/DnrJ/EryC1/StrS family aminotransferase, partial [Lachnospiraceae bacterium]|nr:DegT/DnrJ/EryC1/StrS family aminotransferase [Lachnospiraceae bacterium]
MIDTSNNRILVTRSSMPTLEEYIDEIKELWNTHWLTNMGDKYKNFQEQLLKYLNVPFVEMLSNGHMALELSLQALKLSNVSCNSLEKNCFKKMEVITTPFTFASTTHSIVRNGLSPVFCDIKEDDFTIDENLIENLITDATVAIMPVHVYGNICNVTKIQKIADKYSLKVIYDAAHSFGEKLDGISIGSFGDVSCFSFHATKVFNTIEGGAVCYKDVSFGQELCRLKNFGIKNEEVVDGVGANAKMSEFCAAMGICNLRHIDDEIKKRKTVFDYYESRLLDVAGIRTRKIPNNVQSNYAYYPIVVDEKKFGKTRNEIHSIMQKNNIYTRKYFYPITNSFECYQGKFDVFKTPIALRISKQILCLPMYSDLSVKEIDRIVSIIT